MDQEESWKETDAQVWTSFELRLFKDVNWAHWQTRIRAIMPYSTNAHAV